MEKLSDYIRISEAEEYLGYSQNSLRRWGYAGNIGEIRHLLNELGKTYPLTAYRTAYEWSSFSKQRRHKGE